MDVVWEPLFGFVSQYICTAFYLIYCVVTVGSTEQQSLSSTSSQASPAAVMQFDSYTTFDWDAYLRETNSVTAPPEYYKQVCQIPLEICTCWSCWVYFMHTYQNLSVVTYFPRTASFINIFRNFTFMWLYIVKARWREKNQQDVTNLIFILSHLSQHVLGIIMPIFRRTRLCTTAYGVLHCNKKETSCEVLVP
jgi:hypothetical protein